MSVDVELTHDDRALVTYTATGRQLSAHERRASNQFTTESWWTEWMAHALGISGEIVVARYLGRYWSAATYYVPGAADIDGDPPIEVRTSWRDGSPLRVKRSDNPGQLFVLATLARCNVHRLPEAIRIVGAIDGLDAQRDAWWDERTRAWLVPQAALRPIEPRIEIP